MLSLLPCAPPLPRSRGPERGPVLPLGGPTNLPPSPFMEGVTRLLEPAHLRPLTSQRQRGVRGRYLATARPLPRILGVAGW